MTIFDVIRYPVSSPAKLEELEAIPDELFVDWLTATRWNEPNTLSRYFVLKHLNSTYLSDIPILRKMIKEYEPI